jgi:hypothetical protein
LTAVAKQPRDSALRLNADRVGASWWTSGHRPIVVGGFVPEFLQFLSGENITDLEIGVRACLAYALIEPANMPYSNKSLLTQFSGVRPRFELRVILPLINSE